MGEEVRINGGGGGGDDDRVSDWEAGLPGIDDLTPLSQALIPPDLASAFRISPEGSRSMLDVNRESQRTLTSLRGGANGGSYHHSQALSSSNNLNNFKSFHEERTTSDTGNRSHRDNMVVDIDETDLTREGSDSRKTRRIMETVGEVMEEADSSAAGKNNTNSENCGDDVSARTLKRPRLVWTPQLHKRFVDVVAHLGIQKAVPKTIMQLMNVEGLTRENVASHLQKYRLYLKRMQGLSTEGPSPSDHLFASTPVPQSLHDSAGGGSGGAASGHGHGHGNSNGHVGMPIPMPYPPPAGTQMFPVPMIGMPGPSPGGFQGYESHHHHHPHHHQYSMVQQQRDWAGNKFGAVAPYHHHIAPNDK